MSESRTNNEQIASGVGIAQATNGATASVSIGLSADETGNIFAKMIETFARTLPITGDVVLAIPTLNVEAPPPPELRLERATLERQAQKALSSGKGVSIHGDMGSGRTELARSLSIGYGRVVWLDLHANKQVPAVMALEIVLRDLSADLITDSDAGSNRLLVIDNIDDAILEPAFEARIKSLASKDTFFVILVSLHPLPRSLSTLFECVEVNRLDDQEILKLMKLYGAPKAVFRDGLLNVAIGVTHGMPDLVTLLLKDWQSKSWNLDDAAWEDTLRSNYAKDLRAETQRRLLATQAPGSRDLLYRLTLLNRDFSEKEAIAIAEIEPTIDRARERLYSLSGNWLHRIKKDRWRTSPLLAGSGDGNLSRPIRKEIHSSAVLWVLAKGTLNQFDVSEAITHLMQAERWNEAAMVYIRALDALRLAGVDVHAGMLLSLWKSLPLPKEMALWLRIFIRGLQVINGLRRNEGHQPALEDLVSLIADAREQRDQMSVFAVSGLIAMKYIEKEPGKALPFIASALRAERDGPAELRRELKDHKASELFWGAAMRIKTRADVLAWMAEVNELSNDERNGLMIAEYAEPSAMRMFDSLWSIEQEKAGDQRDWQSVLDCLKRCEEIASDWKTPLVSACILRSQLSVRIVHLKETDSPQIEAERFYGANESHELAQFIVSDGLATWLIDIDRWDLASTWVTRAYRFDKPDFPLHQQLNALRYGHLLLREGAPSAVPFERAIAIGNSSEDLTLFNQLKARAELATFFWKTGQIGELFATWSDVVRGLLEHREDDERWKNFFMLAANNMSFYSSALARTQVDEDLVTEPRPGMFIGGVQSLSSRYRPGLVFLMPGGMAQWADELGKEREAAEWAGITEKIGGKTSGSALAQMYQMHAIPLDVREHRFIDALRHANETALGMLCDLPVELSEERQAELATANTRRKTQKPFSRLARLHLGLFPVLLEMSIGAEQTPAEVRKEIEGLQDEAEKLREDDPEIWGIGLDVLAEILEGRLRWQQIQGAPPVGKDGQADIRVLLRAFGLWVIAADSAERLLVVQASCIPYLSVYFPQMGQIGTTIAISIARMWAAKIEHSPYHFRRPSETVAQIQSLASEARIGEMMLVLADSIGVGTDGETREQFKHYRLRKPIAA
ncbi:P-loop NTPase family protein [Granulicella mallensis]|uniref:AAA ATPase n=1 Tax=Granulicella mallensis (strain ATCC BAA-1857 / DSM 23137 / MP5ACTX8) TaxID=682795 RepID=G8NZH3_GRAMM|nr:ATPase AAA [Granulicella mallensis]AEU38001.1 AAA ATPase [Granulicella mallensis MP5ACTX8]